VFGVSQRDSRWLVRWRVSGRDKSRSFTTKSQAAKFSRQLENALEDGASFDPVTLLPTSWNSTVTVLSFAQSWFPRVWPQWRPRSRSSALDGTVAAVMTLVDCEPTVEVAALLRPWLRQALTPAGVVSPVSSDTRRAVTWLERHSIPLGDIDASDVYRAFERMLVNLNGSIAQPQTFSKKRTGLTRLLGAAVSGGVIRSNPAVGVRSPRRLSAESGAVAASEIPNMSEAWMLVDEIARTGGEAERMRAYLAMTLFAGLRPSEVNALRVADLDLPDHGWGEARVRKSRTNPGSTFTDDGSPIAEGPTKTNGNRDVPLAPRLVLLVRAHLTAFASRPDSAVFANSNGGLLNGNITRSLRTAKTRLGWVNGHALENTVHYSLRHTCASALLDAGVPEAVVAQRLGHSMQTLRTAYWHVVTRSDDDTNARAEAAFGGAGLQGRQCHHEG
jgi:integrase